jgi:predicted aldo/keto reductase-like oxidoreductase
MNCSSANIKPDTDVWTKAEAFRHRATPYVVHMRALQSKLQLAAQLKASLEESRRKELQAAVDELKRLMITPTAVLEEINECMRSPSTIDIPASIQAEFRAFQEYEPQIRAAHAAIEKYEGKDNQTS